MPICLTDEMKEEIINSKELNREIAKRLNIHPSTISRIKRGKQYRKNPHIIRIGKGGWMVCTCCGKTSYQINQESVSCKCGWSGNYYDMLFVKKMSDQGMERLRKNKT